MLLRSALALPVLVLVLVAAPALPGAPFIFYRGIVNAASFAPPALPNGGLARGSIFTIFGRDLGPVEGVQVSSFPLQDELAGVSVEVCQGETCVAAVPLFVRADQINAVMRSDAPLGDVSVRVSYDGEVGNFSPARVEPSSVGLFTVGSAGFGPGIVQNFVSSADQPLNSLESVAVPGQAVTLWATGLGAGLNADNVAPEPGTLPVDVEVLVGGKPARSVLYAGRSPCCAGVDQLVFEIPPDAPPGCRVPVAVRTEGRIVSNTVAMAIGADAASCSDPGNPFYSLGEGGAVAGVFPIRWDLEFSEADGGPDEYRMDLLAAGLDRGNPGPWSFHRLYSLPPAGTCTSYGIRGNLFSNQPLERLLSSGAPLDAGPALSLEPGGVSAGPSDVGTGVYSAAAALERLDGALIPLPLDGPGPFSVAGSGGGDVSAFETDVGGPLEIGWTNRAEVDSLDAAAPLPFRWTVRGEAHSLMVAFGAASDIGRGASSLFLCAADPRSGEITVPPYVLSTAASGPSVVGLIAVSAPVESVEATGVDSGLAASVAMEAKVFGR